MNQKVEQAIQEIDAAIFSEDEFLNRYNHTKMVDMVKRWRSGLEEHRLTLEQMEGKCRLCDGEGKRLVQEFDNYQPTGRLIQETCCDCRGTGKRDYSK